MLLADSIVTTTELKTAIAAFIVGIVVGITGMGGGALMTPALIFLGVGDAAKVVTADLTAAAVYKTGGAAVHWREGSPNFRLAGWLIAGSIPFALLGPHLVAWLAPEADLDNILKLCIGFALLFAAASYALRLYIQLRHKVAGRDQGPTDPVIRPLPTLLVGAVGGLLVGITSVGSGSVIMIALLMLYPTLSAVKLVGTDLVQAVPLVLAAALSNIALHGLDWGIVIPLTIGSVPGCILGAKIAPRVRQSFIRRGIIVVLTMSGFALLDKAGWAPLGAGEDETYPVLTAVVGLVTLVLVPLVWGLLRKTVGLPMFGDPTVEEIEDPEAANPQERKQDVHSPRHPGGNPLSRDSLDLAAPNRKSTRFVAQPG
ncbi:MAG: sulfite exporter TauE/SafE family protein [Nocardioidaceae bacterium]|nr:sulfite exporter TauE/SafE family protein [Nocardioidaceae bacterium]